MTTKDTLRPDDVVLLPILQVLAEIAARVERERATQQEQTKEEHPESQAT